MDTLSAISTKCFYGKKKDIKVLDMVQNPNSSDLEEIEVEDSDTEQAEAPIIGDSESSTSNDESSSDSEDDLPLIHFIRRPNGNVQKNTRHWVSEKDNDFSDNPPPFLSQHQINIDGETPYNFFMKIFPDELFDHITAETIRYAVQSGKEFYITSEEIKQFFAINMVMTYIKYPSYRMYWSSISGIRCDLIADTMALKRYEDIKRYLHFINNEDITRENKDSFIKVRPFLDALADTFATSCTPTEYMAIDEMMIPFKGRSKNKQYIKSKPKKWGFKVWVRASADGYVSKFQMYQSSKDKPKSELGIIGDTVARMCSDITENNHKIFLDNLFTSIPVVNYLKNNGIYVVGTVRSNRMGGAAEKLVKEKELLKQGRGAVSVATSSDNITITRWADNKIVHMISSYTGKEPQDTVKRWDRKEHKYVEVRRPQAVQQYNRFMGGVDMADRMVAHYPHGTKNKKFYMRIAFHFLNVGMINSWILYKKSKNNKIPFVEFKASVASTILKMNGNTRKRGRPSAESPIPRKKRAFIKTIPEIRTDGIGHFPVKINYKNPPRCHDRNCKKRTRYACKKCEEAVCPECMEDFHK